MVPWEPSPPRQCGGWTLCDCCCWLLLPAVLLVLARPDKLAAFPTSLSDCQTPTGWNCSGYDDRENDLFLCDTNTCKFDGECLRIGDSVTCVCQFKCNNDYVPVCGSNGDTYQNECYLKQAACKQQSEILLVSEGSCATDAGSGSGDGVNEGSGETNQKETSTCDICQFGAECDEDAEDVWWSRIPLAGSAQEKMLKLFFRPPGLEGGAGLAQSGEGRMAGPMAFLGEAVTLQQVPVSCAPAHAAGTINSPYPQQTGTYTKAVTKMDSELLLSYFTAGHWYIQFG